MWYLKDYHIHLGIFLLNLNYNLFWILFAFTYDMVNFWKFSLRISWYRENITFQPLFSPHCDHHGEKKQPMPTAQLPLCCSRLCYRWLFLQNLARKKAFLQRVILGLLCRLYSGSTISQLFHNCDIFITTCLWPCSAQLMTRN
jgi:hypothetical protein